MILEGVFSLVIGLAFILPDKRSSEEGNQVGAITSPISWPRQRQPGLLKMMYFWSKSQELSAAPASSATWLLLDRFVPLIREDSDCRHCLCKEKKGKLDGGERQREQEKQRKREEERKREIGKNPHYVKTRGRWRECAGGYIELWMNRGQYLL